MSIFDSERTGFSDMMEADTEFIPLLSSDEEEQMQNEELPEILPILPLRNTVLFPGVVIPITVSRDKSINLVKDSYKGDKTIGIIAQKSSSTEEPQFEDLYKTGTVARIIKLLKMPDGNTTIIIQGKKLFELREMVETEPYFKAKVQSKKQPVQIPEGNKKFEALISSLKDMSLQIIKNSPNIPSEAGFAIKNIESSSFLVNFISSNLNTEVKDKQALLENNDLFKRAEKVLEYLSKEIQMLEIKNQIQSKVKGDIDKQQRDYLLNQQLKTIQEELGDEPGKQEVEEFQEKAKKKKWPVEVKKVFEKELQKFQRMNPAAPEYSIQHNYLDTMLELPWDTFTKDNLDLNKAQQVLDEDHYGLEKVKERIIEYLAVLKLKKDMKSPILCLVGPPGVGKTSLGKSVARAIGRNYFRMSLGGLRDEAEIRGHRKTYIGAMPGRIIKNLKKSKSSNPVFVLDEIDKVGHQSIQGDPASALLEVLDPEQNKTFYDNFLEVEYDLSNIMFIATANTVSSIHPALIDRMEIINISGYIVEEKIEIAKQHLIPKQLKEHGVKKTQLKFSKKILEKIIEEYTRESGVRNLDKNIAKIIRNRAKYIAKGDDYNISLTADDLVEILGAPKIKKDIEDNITMPGIITGLAWTMAGGQIIYIEVSLSKGKGSLSLTGNLGDVMKESARIAYEFLKANSHEFDIDDELFKKWNVHMHIPEGATPKDGPSAGITMFTALVSAFSQRKVRTRIAMTGEITLRGRVLPVGGIKEKILAAKRSNIKEIILSEDNRSDVEEIKDIYIKGIQFHYIKNMKEAPHIALRKDKTKNGAELDYAVEKKI